MHNQILSICLDVNKLVYSKIVNFLTTCQLAIVLYKSFQTRCVETFVEKNLAIFEVKMKFAHITILSLLLLAVYTAAKRLPTHEVLPTPILIHAVKGNPNKYIVENVWYGNGYEDDGT